MNIYNLEGHKVYLKDYTYSHNNSLCVQAYCEEDGCPWSTITVCLDEKPLDDNCAFVDINNNGRGIMKFLVENGIAEPTNRIGASGFCFYPEFRFNKAKLN